MKNFRRVLILILATMLFHKHYAQVQIDYFVENDDFIGWQPNVEFDSLDFQAIPDSSMLMLCKENNYSAVTNIQVYAFLDVAEKKRLRKHSFEEVYIAPVFQKKCSYLHGKDSIEMMINQLYFDIAEYAARVGRMNFDSLRITDRSIGSYTIMFTTLKNDMIDLQQNMNAYYTYEVLANKNLDNYRIWKKDLKESLAELEKYATTSKDCHRIITGEPVKEGYILAPRVVGDMDRSRR